MENFSNITTKRGYTYKRIAWTGGDVAPIGWDVVPLHKDLIEAFYNESVQKSGGLDFWACAGTSAEERKALFMNRAILDAWRTMNP